MKMDEYVNKIHNTDALSFLGSLPDESIHCCVTSPPYFSLRDYGTGTWAGGDPGCVHVSSHAQKDNRNGKIEGLMRPGEGGRICKDCGATREDKQIGIEPSPLEYVQNLTRVFSEFKRVLRKDGTLFLNLGDSYWASSMTGGNNSINAQGGEAGHGIQRQFKKPPQVNDFNLTPKSLIGAPWRVAFAMQDAGWCLRTDIIWSRPNAMPESVRDRPTRDHEFVFMFTKSWHKIMWVHRDKGLEKRVYKKPDPDYVWINKETKREIGLDPKHDDWYRKNLWRGFDYYYDADSIREPITDPIRYALENFTASVDGMRNKRTTWRINTKPHKIAHFAIMPQELVRNCILAGCPPGGIVLDMFMGSGTVALTAKELDRQYTGCELNPEYVKMAEERLSVPVTRQLL